VRLARDPVPSTCTAKAARTAATARTTRNARPSMAPASVQQDTAARTAVNYALRTPLARTVRKSAPARMALAARLRTGAATALPVSEIQRRFYY